MATDSDECTHISGLLLDCEDLLKGLVKLFSRISINLGNMLEMEVYRKVA